MKQKRYWLRGGIIVGILSIIIGIYFLYNGSRSDIITAIYSPGLTALFIFKGGLFSGNTVSAFEEIFAMILNGFIYGAIIGWLYGKFKNRNKEAI